MIEYAAFVYIFFPDDFSIRSESKKKLFCVYGQLPW